MDFIEDIHPDKSYGGVPCNKVEILFVGPHHQFPDVIQDKMTGTITTVTDDWMDVTGQDDSFHFRESPQDMNGSTIYVGTLDAVISKDTIARLRALDKLSKRGYIVRFKDANGVYKIMGNAERGVYITWSRDNKKTLPESNSMEIQWVHKSPRPVPEWSES